MRRFFLFSLLLCKTISILALPIKIEINNGWKFRNANQKNWYAASVPGTIHTDLIQNKIIEDPYFRLNERAVQWVDKEDWIYETTFTVPKEILNKQNINLTFYGLDTYADVYLNGKKVLEADNMFREWKLSVKDLITNSENTLRVYLHSPIKRTMEICDSSAIKYKGTDASDLSQIGGVFDKKLSPYVRKAGYHFGWDWGPRIVTSGIWRPIVLEGWDNSRIENVQIVQHDVSSKSATINAIVEVISSENRLNKKVQIFDDSNNRLLGESNIDLQKGLTKVKVDFVMKNPKLWWSNGLGEPHLYNLKIQLLSDGKEEDSHSEKIGIRSIKVVRQPDSLGMDFHFEVNGIPVFAKGANFIPCDIFLPRIAKETYRQTILDAANTHMNMLRVWGGGIYEDNYFYDLCDEHGILVWQDFMFACKTYPAEGAFMENIRQEAIDNIRRLRNHASLAIWCGNNEIMEALIHWGDNAKGWLDEYRQKNPAFADTMWNQYYNLFHVVLPNTIEEYDPSTFYLPSSPFTDMKATHNQAMGDMHYWTAWSKMLPINVFDTVRARFFSEYGFQSFPNFESVKRYAPEERDWDINSEVMMWHQRGGSTANKRIETCMEYDYGKAKDFESMLYMSQLLQGDAMKIAMESHRRNMPFCMGSLYWQINDCWPVASWASRDYYGTWKAQHYFTRKAYDDILVSSTQKDDTLLVYVVSDRLADFKADLSVKIITFDGKEINKVVKTIEVPKNSSTKMLSLPIKDLLKGTSKDNIVVATNLTEKSGKKYENNYFLLRQKEMQFPSVTYSKSIKAISGGFELSLSTTSFARGVFISVDDIAATFSDNFVDILPNQPKSIIIKTSLSKDALEKKLKTKSLSDSVKK